MGDIRQKGPHSGQYVTVSHWSDKTNVWLILRLSEKVAFLYF